MASLIAAPFAPLHSDGSVNLDGIELLAAFLKAQKVRGAFVCGTTGEGVSLSTRERMAVAERWVRVGDGLEIIIHVGHTCAAEARDLAAHAQSLGVAGIGCTAPFFFKPRSAEVAVDWCATVALGAPQTKFYYYHIPSMTGVDFPVTDYLTVARERIPNLAGAKFTHENLLDFANCLDAADGLEIFFGRDEMLLAGLSLGATSAVGSTYTFAAPLYHRMIEAFNRSDLETARELQGKARSFIGVCIRFGGLNAMKAVMSMLGVDCGPCRLPLETLSNEQAEQMRAELDAIGFFQDLQSQQGA